MPGRPSQSKPLQYVGALVALIAIVGYVVFDWRFGESDEIAPFVIGVVCAILAVGWTLYQRR
ncbi:hypothetical protein DJ69_13510 [Halorubrum persicum]|uniref:Uncharacterized protein n=1 Tax=Halorubrum persicum TaxID=1383844 RepID=A0A2G1WGH7_9EURY|nr:hypothetical protein DJ69_13510 [Halorubrum persicum]